MKKLSKKSSTRIQIVATHEGMIDDKAIQPRPANKFIPSWWKSVPLYADTEYFSSIRKTKTVKTCPSFAHYFSKGFVVPAWCDMTITFNEESQEFYIATGNLSSPYLIDLHPKNQFLEFADYSPFNIKTTAVFKLICPWRIITPNGWSVLQLPMFYENNREWSIMPGIIDTDVHHEINQQLAYTGSMKEIFIAKGEPLALYIPFKRNKEVYEIRQMSKKDNRRFAALRLKYASSWRNTYLNLERKDV